MAYWWAIQNENHQGAMPAGMLWSRPHIGRRSRKDRTALFEMALDEVAFHYGAPFVRAVCRVAASCTGRAPGVLPAWSEGIGSEPLWLALEGPTGGYRPALHFDRVKDLEWTRPPSLGAER